jgi:hypothetical protein
MADLKKKNVVSCVLASDSGKLHLKRINCSKGLSVAMLWG